MRLSTVQAVLFDANRHLISDARRWLKRHKLKPMKEAHLTKKYIRYRIHSPDIFSRMRTINIGNGIKLIIGFF